MKPTLSRAKIAGIALLASSLLSCEAQRPSGTSHNTSCPEVARSSDEIRYEFSTVIPQGTYLTVVTKNPRMQSVEVYKDGIRFESLADIDNSRVRENAYGLFKTFLYPSRK